MQQNDRGSYRTKESAFKQFRHTCLGRIVILAALVVVLLILAAVTNPSEKKMREQMEDNIKESIWSRDSINADEMDIFMSNIGHAFTHFSDSVTADMKTRMQRFNENNMREFFDHTFFSTMYVRCAFKGAYERCGIGVFGLVFPTADFNQFIPPLPIYHDSIPSTRIQGEGNEEYFGTTTVDIFRWEGE